MKRFLMMLALAPFAYADNIKVIGNATELRELLLIEHKAAQIASQIPQRGCGSSGCSIDIAGVSIMQDVGVLLDPKTKKQIEIKPQSSGDLPEIDWEPLGGYAVTRSGKSWGACLEFTHTGLGKSGRFQRWASVLLVPYAGQIAYRFVGYWAGCDVLMEGDKEDEINLPIIEPALGNKDQLLNIIWHSCSKLACKAKEDPRTVREDSSSETGALAIGSKSS